MIDEVHAILDRKDSDGARALFGDLLGCSSVDRAAAGRSLPAR
jgi:hypothetical protein